MTKWMFLLLTMCLGLCGRAALAQHAYAMYDKPKYAADFAHLDYVNVNAPKGGELRLVSNVRSSTFDKYNPFTLKGSPPAYLDTLLFETLLVSTLDETTTAYGLLAQDIQLAPDKLSVTFTLRPTARFHNGDAVLAKDVKHSFETLIGKFAKPQYKTIFEEVTACTVISDRVVRFDFKRPNRELPLTVGALPVFSHKWGVGKSFDKVTMDTPIGSGPYKIGPVVFGRDITYVRDADWWGRDLPLRKGQFNFDKVTVKIYKDNVARLEGLKAAEFDAMRFFSAGDWSRRVKGKRFDTGELVKGQFKHQLPTGFQSFVPNLRRAKFQDVRVRQALDLSFDYDWMNQRLFYGLYTRVNGVFGNTQCQAKGIPSLDELSLLTPLASHFPVATLGEMAMPTRTFDDPKQARANIIKARALFAEAGWVYKDGALRNSKGEPFEIELLDSQEGKQGTFSSWVRNLNMLGIKLKFRAVDFSLYQERIDKFQFDMVVIAFPGTHNPGQEYVDMFSSKTAQIEGSSNYAGVANPAVDSLVQAIVTAKNQQALFTACRALDRVMAHSKFLIPQWTNTIHNMAYNAWRLAKPATNPPYMAGAEAWVIENWWAQAKPSADGLATGKN